MIDALIGYSLSGVTAAELTAVAPERARHGPARRPSGLVEVMLLNGISSLATRVRPW